MTIYTSARFAHHLTPPGHPERPERADVLSRVADRWGRVGARLVEPAAADEAALTSIHTPAYVAAIRATTGRAVWLDADTSTSPESYEVACLAAGAAIGTVDQVLAAPDAGPAFAFVRPPGHHAEAERAMGFCLFNSIAVAAAHARAAGIAPRGDRGRRCPSRQRHPGGLLRRSVGAVHLEPSVSVLSGTGAATEIGQGPGAGFTVNLPLEAGAGDADVDEAYRQLAVRPSSTSFAQLMLVSASTPQPTRSVGCE